MRRQQEHLRRGTSLKNTFLQRGKMAVARQPPIPTWLEPADFGDVTRIGSVINIEPRQFIESDKAREFELGKRRGQLGDPISVAADVAQAAAWK